MNICILTNGYPLTPDDYWAIFNYHFAHKLKEYGHNVYIFTPDRVGEKEEDSEIHVNWFKWSGGTKPLTKLNLFNPLEIIKVISLIRNGNREIVKYVREKKIDLCLVMWAVPSGLFALTAKMKLDIPYSVWCLGADVWTYPKYPIIRSYIKRVLKNADLLFADGVKLADDVNKLSRRECIFLPTSRMLPAVDKEIFLSPHFTKGEKGGFSEKIDIVDKSKTNLLFIGRLERVKGVDILIEAMRLLFDEDNNINVNLYIFGVGSMEGYVNKKIKEYNLGEDVFFKGYALPQVAAIYLKMCDWLVIPSRMESIPVVFSDALQMNTPVIVTDVGDMGYLTQKYDVGEVVKPEDSNELKETIKRVIHSDRYLYYKENTKILAKEFDLGNTVKKYLDMVSNT